ncbi:MAG: hypothetical protein ABIO96_06605 [Nitrospiraceae bacterium]
MPRERISILNFLRASEIFIHERDHYSQSERVLLRAMLGRLDTKVNKTKDTEDPVDHMAGRLLRQSGQGG